MKHPSFRAGLLLLVLAVASGCPSPTKPGGLITPKSTRSAKPLASGTPASTLPTLGAGTPSPNGAAPSQAPTTQPTGLASDASPSLSPSASASTTPRPSKSPGASASPVVAAVTTFAGGTVGLAEGTGTAARFNSPNGIDVDAAGNLYVADAGNHRIRKITPAGVVSTFAGTAMGFVDGPVATATFNGPYGVAVGPSGEVYVADTGNHAIRKITADGNVTTLAGGVEGFVNDRGSAARLHSPFSLACDGFGTLYVADAGNHAIRKITADGTTTTLVANGSGFVDGVFSAAKFFVPNDVALDLAGRLVIADFNNHAIRQIDLSKTEVETLNGNGAAGSANGTKAVAQLNFPTGVAMNSTGHIFVADNQNHRIRLIAPTGELSTLTGSEQGLKNGAVSEARFSEPTDLVVANGALYVADTANNLIRKVALPANLVP